MCMTGFDGILGFKIIRNEILITSEAESVTSSVTADLRFCLDSHPLMSAGLKHISVHAGLW